MSNAFAELFDNIPDYSKLLENIKQKNLPIGVVGLSASAKVNMIYSVCKKNDCGGILIFPTESEAAKACDDLSFYGAAAMLYPARDFIFFKSEGRSKEYQHKRLKVLSNILVNKKLFITCSIEAFSQLTLSPELLKENTLVIKKDDELDLQQIQKNLLSLSYEKSDIVDGIGQFSVRGGILDIFSPGYDNPIRIDLFGDTIEGISFFDVVTQRRLLSISEAILLPSSENVFKSKEDFIKKAVNYKKNVFGKGSRQAKALIENAIEKVESEINIYGEDVFLPLSYDFKFNCLSSYILGRALFVCETGNVIRKFKSVNKLLEEDVKTAFSDGRLCKGFDKFILNESELLSIYENNAIYLDEFIRGSFDTAVQAFYNIKAESGIKWKGSFKELSNEILVRNYKDSVSIVFAGTEKAAENLTSIFEEEGLNAVYVKKTPEKFKKGIVYIFSGSIFHGFSILSEQIFVYSIGEMTSGLSDINKRTAKYRKGKAYGSLDELKKGDYVVHKMYGIGIFTGIKKIEIENVKKDYITLKYKKGDLLYVPITQLDLVSKYIGGTDESKISIKLNSLSAMDFNTAKKRVSAAVMDMADELIALYSKRRSETGFAFSRDSDLQNNFETRFEYEETADQLRASDEIKSDMEKSYPMDRLLCGDVGFGKTEVALRAAFKCISDGKQCAVLVPTTLLALQHFNTIKKRFESFPVFAEVLTRFKTPKEQREIKQRLLQGKIDIIVGTHKLFSESLKFKDLGLLIVDEEQRFGVKQKELLKSRFPSVDVLTLSATPIPRTLNMALSGIRDMSVIEEPPGERHPVETYVLEHNDSVLAEAMERELRRGGQVYYLHNKIDDIESVAAKIQKEIPDAKVSVGNGKMTEEQLSEVWGDMTDGNTDILVCTTIIETGVDIPNANTLIIENADKMGLAQLHQIRGRVGRSARRASAYLTYKPQRELSESAHSRLSAIREYTEFGSGYKIAMRDLQIRGAGDLLGARQHGHIAAVGYDLYIELLNEAVAKKKGEKITKKIEDGCKIEINTDAFIPDYYIENLQQRIDAYKKIADIKTTEDASDVLAELTDRYGKPPRQAKELVEISLLKSFAEKMGILEIKDFDGKIKLFVENINPDKAINLITSLKERVSFKDTGKKFISVSYLPNQKPLSLLKEIFEYF